MITAYAAKLAVTASATDRKARIGMTTTYYDITGMTCEHCVAHVTEEVSAIPGIDAVRVSLEAGSMEVDADTTPLLADITAAVEEAGDYKVSLRQ
jgi:copper chaperone CopZ